MPRTQPLDRLLIAVATLACAIAAVKAAEAQASDLQEVSAYRLSESGLARYSQAIRKLGSLASSVSADCKGADDDGEAAQSIDDVAAKLEAVPGARAALDSAGISSHEFVVFTFALFQTGMASWALDQPGGKLPEGVSMDNVNFYRANSAALEELGQQTKATDCGDAGSSEDGGDEDGTKAEAS